MLRKIAVVSFDSSLFSLFAFCFAQGLKALEEVKVNKQLLRSESKRTACLSQLYKTKNACVSLAQNSRAVSCRAERARAARTRGALQALPQPARSEPPAPRFAAGAEINPSASTASDVFLSLFFW